MSLPIREIITEQFRLALADAGKAAPSSFSDDLVLLQSGLDSMGFAILITQLEEQLGYDPFTLMEEAVYPRTFGSFTEVYERFAAHRKD
jgi:acyl carrier protein